MAPNSSEDFFGVDNNIQAIFINHQIIPFPATKCFTIA